MVTNTAGSAFALYRSSAYFTGDVEFTHNRGIVGGVFSIMEMSKVDLAGVSLTSDTVPVIFLISGVLYCLNVVDDILALIAACSCFNIFLMLSCTLVSVCKGDFRLTPELTAILFIESDGWVFVD